MIIILKLVEGVAMERLINCHILMEFELMISRNLQTLMWLAVVIFPEEVIMG